MADLLAGRVAMLIDGVPPQVKNISAGKVCALAVTTTIRSEVLPNVPTVIESGLPGYDIPFWTAIFAPAKTPRPIVERLVAETGQLRGGTDGDLDRVRPPIELSTTTTVSAS